MHFFYFRASKIEFYFPLPSFYVKLEILFSFHFCPCAQSTCTISNLNFLYLTQSGFQIISFVSNAKQLFYHFVIRAFSTLSNFSCCFLSFFILFTHPYYGCYGFFVSYTNGSVFYIPVNIHSKKWKSWIDFWLQNDLQINSVIFMLLGLIVFCNTIHKYRLRSLCLVLVNF